MVHVADFKAELFQQQNRNTVHDFSAYGKTLEKNHSLIIIVLCPDFDKWKRGIGCKISLLIVIFPGMEIVSEGMI